MNCRNELELAVRTLTKFRDYPLFVESLPLKAGSTILLFQRSLTGQIALLREALDYTADWERASVADRGNDPRVIYRKEIRLAQAINAKEEAA